MSCVMQIRMCCTSPPMKEVEAMQAPSVSHLEPVFSHWAVVQLHHKAAETEGQMNHRGRKNSMWDCRGGRVRAAVTAAAGRAYARASSGMYSEKQY